MASSVPGSPQKPHRRKRQRLSSPTYDDQVVLSQWEIEAFEELDRAISQPPRRSQSPLKPSQSMPANDKVKRDQAIATALNLKNLEPENSQEDEADDRPPSPSDSYVRKENRNPRASLTDAHTDLKFMLKRSPKSLKSPAKSPSIADGAPSGFGSALDLVQTKSDPSFSNDPCIFDEDTWFESTAIPEGAAFASFTTAAVVKAKVGDVPEVGPPPAHVLRVGFQSAKMLSTDAPLVSPEHGEGVSSGTDAFMLSSTKNAPVHVMPASGVEPPRFTGFKTANNNSFAPSAKALREAEQKMKQWEDELESQPDETATPQRSLAVPAAVSAPLATSHTDSSFSLSQDNAPETPTPTRISGFKMPILPASASVTSILSNRKPFKSPLPPAATPKSIHPPLLAHPPSYVASPLNPLRARAGPSAGISAPAAAFTTPSRPSTSVALVSRASSPKKALVNTPLRPNGRPKFVTPFKPGMKPGEAGRSQLEQKPSGKPKSGDVKGKGKDLNSFLDDSRQMGKTPLAASGLVPQKYTCSELESIGINISELKLITPQTALYYAFHTASTMPFTVSQIPGAAATLGSSAALDELLSRGCSLATKEWVDNHWALLLWKLAGMVCMEPERENDPLKKRWCWSEVIRQLQYRYDRDLNSVSRPPIRLITTHDTPPTCPMVLCVSNILWPGGEEAEEESEKQDIPELEVTDGWYRIRAQVDACLAKAIKKRHVRIGGKIATVGARLSTDSKEPAEPLEAYDTVFLKLTGNSTHVAPWHAKLGFQKEPYVATLRSLSPNGGVVAVMDLVLHKAYPVAFLEFVEQNGKKTREGPRNEKDELTAQDQWRSRREKAASKLRYDLERQEAAFAQCADKLEQRARSSFRVGDDDPPSTIEDLLVDLEDALTPSVPVCSTTSTSGMTAAAKEIIRPLSSNEAGWLARAIREKVEKDKETLSESMEGELNDICPPRQVRSFRVLVVHSSLPAASSLRRTHTRKAQLTVWDPEQLHSGEDGDINARDGGFKPGQRYMVTNLVPTQMRSWTGVEGDGFVFLSTRRDSRWVRMSRTD